jgi:hypothetical protein
VIFWSVVSLASLNSVNLVIIGAVCYYGDYPGFCLMDKNASQVLLFLGIITTLMTIGAVAAIARR